MTNHDLLRMLGFTLGPPRGGANRDTVQRWHKEVEGDYIKDDPWKGSYLECGTGGDGWGDVPENGPFTIYLISGSDEYGSSYEDHRVVFDIDTEKAQYHEGPERAAARKARIDPINPDNLTRCRDCGKVGETTGHMDCQYPQTH